MSSVYKSGVSNSIKQPKVRLFLLNALLYFQDILQFIEHSGKVYSGMLIDEIVFLLQLACAIVCTSKTIAQDPLVCCKMPIARFSVIPMKNDWCCIFNFKWLSLYLCHHTVFKRTFCIQDKTERLVKWLGVWNCWPTTPW